MKYQKYIKFTLSIILTVGLSYSFIFAWVNLGNVASGDSLTHNIWNNLIAKINENGNKLSSITNLGGDLGIGTTTPKAKLDVDGTLKVGGSETGVADDDIKAYIQKTMCENRRGVWIDGVGCDEYAYFSEPCTYTTCSCNTGYHMCTFPDLFTGGFDSLRRPSYNNTTTYGWIAGSYASSSDSMFYNGWTGISDYISCTAGTHFMINMNRNTAGNNAWGCYSDTYTATSSMCCKDNQ